MNPSILRKVRKISPLIGFYFTRLIEQISTHASIIDIPRLFSHTLFSSFKIYNRSRSGGNKEYCRARIKSDWMYDNLINQMIPKWTNKKFSKMPSKTSWIETAVNEPKILGKFIPHHLNISIRSKVGVVEKREWFLPRILSRMWLKWHLIVELPVLVGTEERRPHLRHRVFCDHLEPCLERVVNLDLALVSVHLYPASTRSLTYVKSEYSLLQIMITNRLYVQKNVL